MNFVVRYAIDNADRIIEVNDEWTKFALENDAADLTPSQVIGRSLYEFVSDPTTVELYRQLVVRTRSGRIISFPFRCDSSRVRRQMMMTMRSGGNGRVFFDSDLVQETPIAMAMPVWDRQAPRSAGPDALLTACGWCKRLKLDDHWLEAEEAISASGLFNRAVLPQLTHGICASCYASVLDVLEAS